MEDGHLYLEGLEVDLNTPLLKGNVQAPPISGSLPRDSKIEDAGSMFEYVYRDLHLAVDHTGPLIIRTDKIAGLVHYRGFLPSSTFVCFRLGVSWGPFREVLRRWAVQFHRLSEVYGEVFLCRRDEWRAT